MAYELSDSVTIAASPAQVFAVISDITRTGEWSAQCDYAAWDSDARSVGATFTGHNRTVEREWTTVSEIVATEPGVEFSWRVTPGHTLWGYHLEPVHRRDDATVLTEYTAFTSEGEEYFQQKYGDDAAVQEARRKDAAIYGITETLQNIKALFEG